MIKFTDVHVKKGGSTILNNITVSLEERRIGVIGRNGSGKSTFARLFNGIETPTTGTVAIAGVTEAKALRQHVGFVFQNPDNQIVYPIVEEDIAFGLRNLKLPVKEIEKRTEDTLRSFDLNHLRHRFTHELSGGEKQLIALAGVLVMRPRVIVLDEPTTLLDLLNKRRLMSRIRDLEQYVILVSHDLDLMYDFDRVLHFESGSIVGDGDPDIVVADYIARSQC